MNPRQREFVRKIALERMYRLMELAEENFKEKPERSREYIQLMKRISSRNNTPIPRELKEKFCKNCCSVLEKGVNCSVRVKKDFLLLKCKECGEEKKVFLEKEKLVIGLTGGVASGKNEVARILKEKGAEIIDADEIAKEVEEKREVKRRIVREFGGGILRDGRIEHKKLGEIVFSDKRKLMRLNGIVHPPALKEIRKRVRKSRKKVVVINAPLLLEAGMKDEVNKVIVVSCSKEKQLERMEKRGFSREEAMKRINAQIPLKEKERKADFVIENNNGLKELRKRVLLVWEKLKEIK